MTSILKVDEIQNTDGKTGIVITPDGSLESVKFPEQSNPSGRVITSTTMSSYEQGTWTPVGDANVTVDSIQNATYTKVGQQVTLTAWLTVTTTSATIILGGVPFAVTSNERSTGSINDVVRQICLPNQILNNVIYIYNNTVGENDTLISVTYFTEE